MTPVYVANICLMENSFRFPKYLVLVAFSEANLNVFSL